jgi:hypothetical protein
VMASACGSVSRTRRSTRLALPSGVGETRAAPRWTSSADSRAGMRWMASSMVWPRARARRACQPHTSITTDWIRDPARPMAWAISGQASSLRSTRTLARRRRCAHQGIAATVPVIAAMRGRGVWSGPRMVPAVIHTPVSAAVAAA